MLWGCLFLSHALEINLNMLQWPDVRPKQSTDRPGSTHKVIGCAGPTKLSNKCNKNEN